MAIKTEQGSAEQAWERSQWCSEVIEAINDHRGNSDQAARVWWNNECDKPEWLAITLLPNGDLEDFIERLQAVGYQWAETSGELAAEEDGFGNTEVGSSPPPTSAIERVSDSLP